MTFGGRGFGGRHAPIVSPRQLKEVIQVAHTNVGSVASLGRWLVARFIVSQHLVRAGCREGCEEARCHARDLSPTDGRSDAVAARTALVRR